ncbi:MAG: hypothetical protein AAB375_01465 [Patescibacteria group bacterium]
MNDKTEPLLSIGDDGIRMNLKRGDSIKINATKCFMRDVEETVDGGNLEHRATEKLVQSNNIMKASEGGQILNEAENGGLIQEKNIMQATRGGVITNRARRKMRIISLTIAIPLLADIASLLLFGEHIWNKLF